MMGSMKVISCISLLLHSATADAVPTIREALLTEARHRLHDWFLNKEWGGEPPYGRLDWPKKEFGVELQITTGNYLCDSETAVSKKEADWSKSPWDEAKLADAIPITFGRFDVPDAEPIDVFNALSDILSQKSWDPLVGAVSVLGDFPNEVARGAAVTFVAHPFPDRQVYQWQVYNATRDQSEMMVAFSTRRNDQLHKLKEQEAWPAVQAENCLGAYWVVALPQGGCHVVFSSMVNSHPPWPITAQFVFNLLWTKTVEYIQNLRTRAQALKKARGDTPAKFSVPEWLVFDGATPDQEESGKFWLPNIEKTVPPFSGSDYVADVVQKFEVPKIAVTASSRIQSPVVVLFAGLTMTFASFAVYKRLRMMKASGQPTLSERFGEVDEEEQLATPVAAE